MQLCHIKFTYNKYWVRNINPSCRCHWIHIDHHSWIWLLFDNWQILFDKVLLNKVIWQIIDCFSWLSGASWKWVDCVSSFGCCLWTVHICLSIRGREGLVVKTVKREIVNIELFCFIRPLLYLLTALQRKPWSEPSRCIIWFPSTCYVTYCVVV